MFPAGAAGCGLVLLRLCAAGMLVHNSTAGAIVSIAKWEIAGVVVIAAAFCLGAFTPITCSVSALMQVFMLLSPHAPSRLPLVFALCVTAALFFLGPGAFSIDSHLYGRRLIVHTDSK
jgi:hypothetical protein